MHALLTALVLAVSPDVPVTPNPGPSQAAVPRRSFWVQPIGTAVMGLALREDSALYLPLGANLPLGEDSSTSLGIELTVMTGAMRAAYEHQVSSNGVVPRYWRVLAAAGPVFSLSGRPLSGPFVQPKLFTNVSYEPEYDSDEARHTGGTSVELHLGLDLGWQFTVGPVYIAPVLGASVGYGFNLPGGGTSTLSGRPSFEPSRVLAPRFVGFETKRGSSPVVGANLNLLRVGAVF
ncbi:hypothetical protein [Vitiosangium sp. GDMCC 1.1324]|uniref:hypothetical protein n=1 Tax=Vitiosangium sp. (strain GDMCC 1.1324) TaxID=2138576 RepID=UPI0011B4FBD1|nr:hypothetical protein [Vitiosangium sp. GDMCC 1.1324]